MAEKEPATKSVTEPKADKASSPKQAPEKKAEEKKPAKKSRKGCCIGILVVFVLYVLLNIAPFIFSSLFRSGSKDFPIPVVFNSFKNADSIAKPESTASDTNSTNTNPPNTSSTNSSQRSSSGATSSTSSSSSTNNTTTPSSSSPGSSGSTSVPPASGSSTGTPPPTTPPAPVVYTKQQQIDFFVQVAMKNDQNGYVTTPIQKWRTNVGAIGKIRYYNNPTASALACADATISQINSLSKTIHFSKTTGDDYDVRLYFVPKSQIPSGVGGYYNLSTDAANYVTGGNAYVPVDTYNEMDQCHLIRHEMTHVMTGLVYNGLKNHGGYDFSIFNVSSGKSDYLDIDKYAIKIMLNSGVGLGWGESQVRNFLANASW